MEDCAKIAGVGGTTSDNRVFEAGRFSATMSGIYDKVVKAAGETLAGNVYYLNGISQPAGAKNGIKNLNALIGPPCSRSLAADSGNNRNKSDRLWLRFQCPWKCH